MIVRVTVLGLCRMAPITDKAHDCSPWGAVRCEEHGPEMPMLVNKDVRGTLARALRHSLAKRLPGASANGVRIRFATDVSDDDLNHVDIAVRPDKPCDTQRTAQNAADSASISAIKELNRSFPWDTLSVSVPFGSDRTQEARACAENPVRAEEREEEIRAVGQGAEGLGPGFSAC